MNSKFIVVMMIYILTSLFMGTGGYLLCLISKQIKWEIRFHKTVKKISEIEDKGNAPSIDWTIGARWALVELIKKGDS